MRRDPFAGAIRTYLLPLAVALAAAGCTISGSRDTIDYRSADEAPSLELPPDLTAPQGDDRFAVPDVDPKGVATYSAYSSERSERATSTAAAPVATPTASFAPGGGDGLRIERAGSQRWLVVDQTPAQLWPKLREFWIELGFVLKRDEPAIGIMETDWAEDRAKIPQDFLRNTLGRVIDNVYSTPERDKFRTRVEAGAASGASEIYISHRGVVEIYPDEARDRTIWQPRAADPELEAEMLRRLMVKLGATEERAGRAVAVQQAPERARIESADGGSRLIVDESFDRAWRRVGLSLDRTGFTVEDRDRSQGIYFVRYVDPEAEVASGEKGLLSWLAFWRDDEKPKGGDHFRIHVEGQGEGSSVVKVLSAEGGADDGATARRILTVLHEQLR
ncbi:MAG: outer membrane protein assembly factor BamC [Rhodocyclaceae bacterium]|nr:outer membrane protein assembly factor BamC [Rhodocyclaceae bacterium]